MQLLPTLKELHSGALPPRLPSSMYINQDGQDVRYHTLSVLGCQWRHEAPSSTKCPKLSEAPAALMEAIPPGIVVSPTSGQLAVTKSNHHPGSQELLSGPVALDPPVETLNSYDEAAPSPATLHSLGGGTRMIEQQRCQETGACKQEAVSPVSSKRGSCVVDADCVEEDDCDIATTLTLSAQLRSQGELLSGSNSSAVQHSSASDLTNELVFDSIEDALSCMANINWQLQTRSSGQAMPTLQSMRECHKAYKLRLAALLRVELASWLHLGVLLPAGDET